MEITPNKKLISISKPTLNLSPSPPLSTPFPGIKTSAWTSWRRSRMCGTSSTRMTSTTNRRRPAKIEVSRCMLFSGPLPAVRFAKFRFIFDLFILLISLVCWHYTVFTLCSSFTFFWFFFTFLFMFSSFFTFFVCSVFIWLLSQFALNASWGELNDAFCFWFLLSSFSGFKLLSCHEVSFLLLCNHNRIIRFNHFQRREQCESGGGDSRRNWFASFLSLPWPGLGLGNCIHLAEEEVDRNLVFPFVF